MHNQSHLTLLNEEGPCYSFSSHSTDEKTEARRSHTQVTGMTRVWDSNFQVFFHCVNSFPLFLWVPSSASPILTTPYTPNPPQTMLPSGSPPNATPQVPINPGICNEIRNGSNWPGTHPWGCLSGRIYTFLLLRQAQGQMWGLDSFLPSPSALRGRKLVT